MSTTEHDLAAGKSDDALDEMLTDDEFDDAMNDALDEAEVELELGDDGAEHATDDAGGADDESVDDVTAEVSAASDDDDDETVDVLDAEELDEAVDADEPDEVEARVGDVDDDDVADADELTAADNTDDDDELVDVLDEADEQLEVDESDEVEALVGDDDADIDDDGAADDDVADDELTATDDRDDDSELDDDVDEGTARHGIRPATTVVDIGEGDDEFELPEIVPATPEVDDADADDRPIAVTPLQAREFVPAGDPADDDVDDADELDDDTVSDEILEELRRADIDGPVVDLAPQDDTAARRRRPRRRADYDPAPMPIPAQIPRVLGRKPRVRKVTRVVRHVDPWSVFKIALVAHVVLYIIVLTAGVLLWNVAHATGTVDNVERFFESFGWAEFEFDGGEIYHASWIAGLFVVIGFTGLAVLAATLFNLITDLVGGMRFTVLEEEVVETRVSPMRRFVVRRPEPEVPAVLRDESGAMIREAVVDDTGANQRPSR